jgi:hypothetical protein
MKEKFKCKLCHTRFNAAKNIPRILPCNASICDNCVSKNLDLIKSSSSLEFTFNCTFCSKTHEIKFTNKEKTVSDLPLDSNLLLQMRQNAMDTRQTTQRNDEDSQFQTQTNINGTGYRRMSLVLEDVNSNTQELNTNIKSSKEKLLANFSQIEAEINARTDKLVADLNESRERLLKELSVSKASAMSRLDEALDTYTSIKTFQQEYQKMCTKLNEKVIATTTTDLDKRELRNIASLAEDLNHKIEKTNFVIRQMSEKSYFKFIKPATAVDATKLIGKLQFEENNAALLFSKIVPVKSENDRKASLGGSGNLFI